MSTLQVTRDQLMAYRILAGGLDRSITLVAALPVWDVGLQDRDGAAASALAARLPEPEFRRWLDGDLVGDPGGPSDFALVWSLRGSPHLHRREDLQRVADAIWPRNEKDALARLLGSGKTLLANGSTGLAGYRAVAAGMRSVVTSAMRKSAASAALTSALPAEFSSFCAPCGSVHVMEMLFRCASLAGGIGLLPGRPATLAPLTPTVGQPQQQAGLGVMVQRYLRLSGAATVAEVAVHLGTTATQLRPDWPSTEPLIVNGITLATTTDLAFAIADADVAAAALVTRLLPPGDPLLQSRERGLLIEDTAAWKILWPSINPAGAVLIGTEIAGYWRPKKTGPKLTLTVTGFRRFTTAERTAILDEAQLVGSARAVDSVDLVFA